MAINDTLLPLQIVANYNNKKGGVMLHTQLSNPICPLRQKIRDFYRIDEDQAVDHILPQAEVNMRARSRAWERARKMVLQIRREQERHGGVDALLNEFSLSTAEGIVLMCLAEALLRVPDKDTQDELIRDKLTQGEWTPHLGNSDSLFVNVSAWGLLFTGNMVEYADEKKKAQFGLLKKTIGRLGEPVIRKSMTIAMKVMGRQFVMGETIKAAVKRAKGKESHGYVYSYDMLGEGARTQEDADRYYQSYESAIHVIGKAANGKGPIHSPGISVKLSAIHPRYEFTHSERALAEIPAKLKALCLLAKQYDIGLTVDAEESERLDISLDIIEVVFSDPELGDWEGFGLAVQAYQKRAIHVIEWLRVLTQTVGRRMMVRLVKGAYWDSEIKHTQQMGLDEFPVFTRKSSTDVSYHACANKLLDYRDTIFPQFATHNAYTASVIIELAGGDSIKRNEAGFEFQCLHGMGDSLYDQVVREVGIQCRVYAPVGEHEDLLAYLVRRLLENGANSSFVNAIVNPDLPVESLLSDPVERTQRLANKANPHIVRSKDMFGAQRINSKGLDINDSQSLIQLQLDMNRWVDEHIPVMGTIGNATPVFNPANLSEKVGELNYQDAQTMLAKLDTVQGAFADWSATNVTERSGIINRIADALERHMPELIALCVKEAGKVTQDSIDEIREAVDFCRYYAAQAQILANDERLQARGVILCISPWNFPLAIFLGQIVAALATGNTVLAKPAEQTSLMALFTLNLMHSVGLPEGTVELIIAPGQGVGETLLPDPRIKAVMFTGSTQTGTLISKILAQRGGEQVPLIAETGGQNCMIVDSTALPEQVVDDVIASGFQSAGQRCSAMRVLFVHEKIADNVIRMIKGALAELHIGDPGLLETDVGPVIDSKALHALTSHVTYMDTQISAKRAQLLYQSDLGSLAEKGHFFAPRLYEIDHIDVLEKEVFGPVVHVIRFKGNDVNGLVEQINATGFGLTMGIHTRIESRAVELARLSRAGNIYINRNMIGAVVGVQPFGGRGLSGTGPKAGGPHYLPRLLREVATPKASQIVDIDDTDPALQSDAQAHVEAQQFMKQALAIENPWRLTSLNDRISAVRQLLAKIATVDSVDEFADDLNHTLAAARDQLIHIEKRLHKPTELPGPTGEYNALSLEPRGVLICFADKDVTFDYWTLSIVTALATGNVVVAVVSDVFYVEAMAFRDKLIATGTDAAVLQVAKLRHLDALLQDEHLAGVVVDSNTDRSAYIASMLASRNGAILPVITAEYNDNLIQRLVTEKTISIDTTASGGNTSLMTLVDDE